MRLLTPLLDLKTGTGELLFEKILKQKCFLLNWLQVREQIDKKIKAQSIDFRGYVRVQSLTYFKIIAKPEPKMVN